jgi:hypothetical protein
MAHGVSVDIGQPPHILVGVEQNGSPAALVRGLNDILWLER